MNTGLVIHIEGARGPETAAALARRLEEHHGEAVVAGATVTFRSCLKPASRGAALTFHIDPHDPPEFAAEKILDLLAEQGQVALAAPGVSTEEEARLEQRLRQLGYLE